MTLLNFSVVDVGYKRNNKHLFSNIAFSLQGGESLHIKGENGVGKTTLLRLLTGIAKPQSGAVYWQGKAVYNNPEYQKQLFFLGHKNAIKCSLTAEENLLLSASFREKPTSAGVLDALKFVGLAAKQSCLARALSSGQRQRLALSMLLLSKAKIWILDEPFTFLDQAGMEIIQSIMAKHLEDRGLLIFTSHQGMDFPFLNHREFNLTSVRGLA
jgi:heme exporter protein A